MAIVLGTNAGFVTEAPDADPGGSTTTQDLTARAHKDTTPAGITKITEIGWWCDTFSEEANFEVALYSHDAGNDLPENILYSDIVNAKGTTPGWKTVAVDWDVSPETTYWIALQLDNTSTATKINFTTTGGRTSVDVAVSALQNPWINDGVTDYIMTIYAVVEAAVVYADLVGTGGGIGDGSGILTKTLMANLVGTGGGVGGGSAALLVSGFPSEGAGVSRAYKRIVAAGNDRIYYEDI